MAAGRITLRRATLESFQTFAADPAVAVGSENNLSVTDLTKAIREVLEPAFSNVTVEGEISNFIDHRSGHRYWTLKDSASQISCVFWMSRPVSFELRDGMKVVCRGRLTVYPPRGNYQFDVFQVRPSGIGELQQIYEERYARLLAEGLFEESRKRPIPKFPQTIGIVTSENGAALHDILTTLERRWPLARVLLRPAAVQGVGAELEIARAIQEFNLAGYRVQGIGYSDRKQPAPIDRSSVKALNPTPYTLHPSPDLLIVGRGGGSLEDLWCFNEEAVARAIFASKIPVISAVGHEVDFTIADFVADLRAPTPTAAAELATPNAQEILGYLIAQELGIAREVRSRLSDLWHRIESASNTRSLVGGLRNVIRSRSGELAAELVSANRSVSHSLERLRLKLERNQATLAAVNPDRVLDRGFTALETIDGKIIPRLEHVLSMDEKHAILIFADGRITVRFD